MKENYYSGRNGIRAPSQKNALLELAQGKKLRFLVIWRLVFKVSGI
jgi:hypothetical protein